VEIDRPKRPARRSGKSDALDAVRAAREALAKERLGHRAAAATGRRCGCCWPPASARCCRTDAINQLKALIVGARGAADRTAWPVHAMETAAAADASQ
jgi:hypothetical protein